MQEIIEYINEKYAPVSVIVYGSYSNGTNNKSSDFDGYGSCDFVCVNNRCAGSPLG